MKKLLLGFITLATTACTPPVNLYGGPARPLSDVATIHLVSGDVDVESFQIDAVDINELAMVNLLPGKHTVRVAFRAVYQNANWSTDIITPGIGSVSRAKCTATITTKENQTLAIFLNSGSDSLIGGRANPRLAIRKEGFNMPDIVKGNCEILPDGITLQW